MQKCPDIHQRPETDKHPCLPPESIHRVTDRTNTEKEEADLMFHFIFHPGCQECTRHVLDGICKCRNRVFDTVQNIPAEKHTDLTIQNEEHLKRICRNLGVRYPRQNIY